MLKIRIGFISTSQLSFPGDKEAQFRRSVEELKHFAERLDFDLYVYADAVIVEADAEKAVKAAEDNGVDFLLVQCTSFSGGFLAPVLARVKNARLGLWAIPEGAEEVWSLSIPFAASICIRA